MKTGVALEVQESRYINGDIYNQRNDEDIKIR